MSKKALLICLANSFGHRLKAVKIGRIILLWLNQTFNILISPDRRSPYDPHQSPPIW